MSHTVSVQLYAFEPWCWRRLLRVPWTARRSNQSILKEISPVYSLERLMLKLSSNPLATWCEEVTHLKRPWCWARLRAGAEGDDRGWDGWMAWPTRWTWVQVDSRSWWWTRRPGVLQFMGRKESDMTEQLNWTDWNSKRYYLGGSPTDFISRIILNSYHFRWSSNIYEIINMHANPGSES